MKFLSRRGWILAGLIFFVCEELLARAGGGHSYGGGGHSSGGGGYGGYSSGGYHGRGRGGGLTDMVAFLVRLTIARPLIGIPIDLFVLWLAYQLLKHRFQTNFVAGSTSGLRSAAFRRADLSRLRQQDPGFSLAYFADFTYALFAEIHKARGESRLQKYSSYLSDPAMRGLTSLSPGIMSVQGILVGGWHILSVGYNETGTVEIQIEFEANYLEKIRTGNQRWFSKEVWTFTRAAGVVSKPPQAVNAQGCPSCGARLEYSAARICKSCGQRISDGTYDWFIRTVRADRTQRPPEFAGHFPEVGTDLPTLYARDLEANYSVYTKAHPEFDFAAFLVRTQKIFIEIQNAWSERRWEMARPYETDRLFQMHYYFIEEYKAQGLRNKLTGTTVKKIEMTSLVQDPYATSITVRIFAAMLDTTVDERGRLVGGDPKKPRVFSEYWTFIRGETAGAKPITPFGNCPSCGAKMKVGMSGKCDYCGGHVTTGQFDWVLSMIEQDETYQA